MENDELVKRLEHKAKTLRLEAVKMMKSARVGWLAGSLSQADVVTALYFHHMKHDPENPTWANRDRFIISKSHCAETVYAALSEAGYFPKGELLNYGKTGALLQAHADRKAPGIEYSGGSLGEGLSFGLGAAIAARMGASKDKSGRPIPSYRVFCILGDGEMDEGQNWEAIMAASHFRVDNLVAIVDYNKFQSTTDVSSKMNLEPLANKWRDFGWDVTEIDGHNFKEIVSALERADKILGKPHCIIAHTITCKGLPSCENKNLHWAVISDEMYAEAVEALE